MFARKSSESFEMESYATIVNVEKYLLVIKLSILDVCGDLATILVLVKFLKIMQVRKKLGSSFLFL